MLYQIFDDLSDSLSLLFNQRCITKGRSSRIFKFIIVTVVSVELAYSMLLVQTQLAALVALLSVDINLNVEVVISGVVAHN